MIAVLQIAGWVAAMLITIRGAYVLQSRYTYDSEKDIRAWSVVAGLVWPAAWLAGLVWLTGWLVISKLFGAILFRPVKDKEVSHERSQ